VYGVAHKSMNTGRILLMLEQLSVTLSFNILYINLLINHVSSFDRLHAYSGGTKLEFTLTQTFIQRYKIK